MNPRFVILNPCAKRWDELDGAAVDSDARQRQCATCKTPVYAIDDFSSEEWRQIWSENNGHVCGFLNRSVPEPPRSRRAMLIGAFFTMISPLFAQSGRVRIRVTDITGAVVPAATIELLDSGSKVVRTGQSDAIGELSWTLLLLDGYRIRVSYPGFKVHEMAVTPTMITGPFLSITLEAGEIMGLFGPIGGEPPAQPVVYSPISGELETGRVRIRVTDVTGAVVPTATADLLSPSGNPIRSVRANENGEIILVDLPSGDNHIRINCAGFNYKFLSVTASGLAEVKIDTVLEVGSTVGTVVSVDTAKPKRHWWWPFH